MIAAYGAGQGVCGAKNASSRPGLIVADDIEDPEHVISEEQREKLREWFTGTLLHAGHPGTNVIVVSTVLHHDSLLANLVNPNDSRGWTALNRWAILICPNGAPFRMWVTATVETRGSNQPV